MKTSTLVYIGIGVAIAFGIGLIIRNKLKNVGTIVKTRGDAISIIEKESGGKKITGTYTDDYLISRANAILAKQAAASSS